MNNIMKEAVTIHLRFIILVSLTLVIAAHLPFPTPAAAGRIDTLILYPAISGYTWKEYVGEEQILKESGSMLGVGMIIGAKYFEGSAGALSLRGQAEIFGGEVGYDGETQPPDIMPVTTNVTYFGGMGKATLGWRVPLGEQSSLEYFAGIDGRWWMRDLQETTTIEGSGNTVYVAGVTEYWTVVSSLIGARVDVKFEGDWQLFGEVTARYPFYVENSIDDYYLGTFNLNPDGEWSVIAELGFGNRWVRPAIYYERLELSKSPPESGGFMKYVYQPDSRSDIFGIRIGIAFK